MPGRRAEVMRVLGLMGLLLGCGSRSEHADDDPPAPEHTAEVALEVENHGWSDIVISLVRGTSVERLGMVGGLNTETFVFPYRKLGAGTDVRLRAYPIGGPKAYTSENVLVQPGQWIKWTLESDLTRSFLGVY
jgi:hypothetical protein